LFRELRGNSWDDVDIEQLYKSVDRLKSVLDNQPQLSAKQWKFVSQDLIYKFSPLECLKKYKSLTDSSPIVPSKDIAVVWSSDVDSKILNNWKTFGNIWEDISVLVGDISSAKCLLRFRRTLNPAVKKGKWKQEEDERLKQSVEYFKVSDIIKWTDVSIFVPGRTDIRCRERYVNNLCPSVDRSVMSEEEEQKLMSLIQSDLTTKGEISWAEIRLHHFPNRSDKFLKNMHLKFERARKAKVKDANKIL
jgi:myb proto-oncogene protein